MTTGPNFYHWYCQHVLPLVYDESLSYYEVLCKLTKAMGDLTKTQQDYFQEVDKAINAMEQVINVAWPEFQQTVNKTISDFESKVNITLEDYESDYTKFTDDWNEKLSGNQEALDSMQSQITYMDQQLTAKLQEQDANIAAALQSNLNTINAAIAAQNQRIEDFITEYDPTPIPTIMYPQAVVTTGAGATVSATLLGPGGKTLTATADTSGKAILNLPAYGDWQLVANSSEGESNSVILTVDDVKQYTVSAPIIPPSLKIHIDSTVPATAAACFNQSVYKITKPDSTTSTVPAEANDIVTETFSAPGTYTVEWMAANVIPTNTTAEGFIKTGTSIIYTSVQSKTVTLSSTLTEQTINFTPATMSITCDPAHTIEVTPPVVTESKTVVSTTQSPYIILPWAKGQWIVGDGTTQLNKGYTYKTSIMNVDFSILKGVIDLNAGQESVTFSWPVDIINSVNTTPLPVSEMQTVVSNLLNKIQALGIILGGITKNGAFIGYIFNSTNNNGYSYKYEDGTDFLPDHIIGYVVPRFYMATNTPAEGPFEVIFKKSASYSPDKLFQDRNGVNHHAVFYCLTPYSSTTGLIGGLKDSLSSRTSSERTETPIQESLYPANIENARIEHAGLIFFLIASTAGTNYRDYYTTILNIKDWDLTYPARFSSTSNRITVLYIPTRIAISCTNTKIYGAKSSLWNIGSSYTRIANPSTNPPNDFLDLLNPVSTNTMSSMGGNINPTNSFLPTYAISDSGKQYNQIGINKPGNSSVPGYLLPIAYLDN